MYGQPPRPFLLLWRKKYPSFLPINNSTCAHIPLLWAPALSIISCMPYMLTLFLSPCEYALLSPFSSLPLTLPPSPSSIQSYSFPSLNFWGESQLSLFTSQSIKIGLLITRYLGTCEAGLETPNRKWQISSAD